MRKVLVALFALSVILIAALPSQAQHRRSRRRIKKPQIKLNQIVAKSCILDEETEGCAIDPSVPEPETGIPNSKVICSHCIIFGKAVDKPAPCYPQEAKSENISGDVEVKMVVDEEGKVIWARAINGHPILQQAAVRGACRTRFIPSTVIGRNIKVKVVGVMTYKFMRRDQFRLTTH